MENFKEIAEKCFAGELSGTFVLRDNRTLHSKCLIKMKGSLCPYYIDGYYYSDNGNCYNRHLRQQNNDVIDFISDNMQKKIEINIPEGKVPVVEQTEKGVVITWKEHELTYTELLNEFRNNLNCIHINLINSSSQAFHKKVEVLRKLTNIRNYFGKPDNMSEGWCITYSKHYNTFNANYINDADRWFSGILFKEGEHAEQAIKMLGDELKYLFEPW